MTEELKIVSVDQAKLLKEFGFPQTMMHDSLHNYAYFTDEQGFTYSMPPLEVAARWLGNSKGLFPMVKPSSNNYYPVYIVRDVFGWRTEIQHALCNGCETVFCDDYDEALSFAINEVLKVLDD